MTLLQDKYPNYPTVYVSIDGNATCALIGENLQEGHAEFVEVIQQKDESLRDAEQRAGRIALALLRNNYGAQLGFNDPESILL